MHVPLPVGLMPVPETPEPEIEATNSGKISQGRSPHAESSLPIPSTPATLTIGQYLIQRLHEHGVEHVFGVPGDFVLGLNHLLDTSPLVDFVNTCDEQGAGFAADAYARIKGLGAVCVTYCVGGLKVANTTAQAFAEKSPVVVISGSPGQQERVHNPLLHHKVKDFDTQYKVFQEITVGAVVLDTPATACAEIDRMLSLALRYKRPVYIEIPRDMVHQVGAIPAPASSVAEQSDANTLEELLAEAIARLNQAEHPVILAGVELHRFGLQEQLRQLAEKTCIPVAATLLGKSVLAERHPAYLGVYEGAMGREDVRQAVESSDCLLLLGAFLSDINLGIFTAQLDPKRSINVTSERASVQFHDYANIRLQDFVQGLLDSVELRSRPLNCPTQPPPLPAPFQPQSNQPITVARLFERLNSFITPTTSVIADTGDALFAGADLTLHGPTEFLAGAYYASLGFAVPASLGAQLAAPHRRPLVLVGDGAFQMTGLELSTSLRYGLSPVVVVLNNGGYGTERPMQDGKFNDVLPWQYHKLPLLLGAGQGYDIHTEQDLQTALEQVSQQPDQLCILEVHLDGGDRSIALQRLTQSLGAKVKG